MVYSQASVRKFQCLRCRCLIETTSTDEVKDAVVVIGMNLFYCHSCAEKTGHPERRSASLVQPKVENPSHIPRPATPAKRCEEPLNTRSLPLSLWEWGAKMLPFGKKKS